MKLIFIPLLPSSSSRIPTFIGCLPSEVKQIFVPARLNLCLPWSCHAHLLLSPSMKALRGMPDSAAFQTYLSVPNIKQKSQSLFTFTVCTVLDSIVILFFFFGFCLLVHWQDEITVIRWRSFSRFSWIFNVTLVEILYWWEPGLLI